MSTPCHRLKSLSNIQGGVTYFASIFKLPHRQREAGRQAGCLVKRLATRMVLSLCHCIQSVIFARGGNNSYQAGQQPATRGGFLWAGEAACSKKPILSP